MARTSEQALPYWQFDVGLFDDIKIVDLCDRYGPLGEGIYFRILSIIAKTDGYYTQINNQLILSIYRSLGKWIKDRAVVSEVIQYCGVCGLFDVNLLTQSVITSYGIQRRWLYAKQKSRSRGYSTALYWLISDENQSEDVNMRSAIGKGNSCSNNSDKCSNNSDKCSNNSPYKVREDKVIEDDDSVRARGNHQHHQFIDSLLVLMPKIEIDCSVGNDIDTDRLLDEIRKSSFLRVFRKLSELIKQYPFIIKGKHRDFPTLEKIRIPKTASNSARFDGEREYTKEELDSVFDSVNNFDDLLK